LKAIANEDAARANMYASVGSFLPSVDVSASAGKSDTEYPMERDSWSVGIRASMPLFAGGNNYYSYRSARETYKASSYNRISLSRSILADISSKYSGYVEAIARLKVDEAYVQASETRATIARQKYNNGLTTFDEWDRIENDLISQQKRLVTSKQNRVVSEAAFEQILGIGVIE
jgi:outer membrane protein TolC